MSFKDIFERAAVKALFNIDDYDHISFNRTDETEEKSGLTRFNYNFDVYIKKSIMYVIPMEGTQDEYGNYRYAYLDDDDVWSVSGSHLSGMESPALRWQVSSTEFENAPSWIRNQTPVEVPK